MQYTLLNYDHGCRKACRFDIGPFQVTITDELADNLSRLPTLQSVTFGWDKKFAKAIKHQEKKQGGWVPTAIVQSFETKPPSSLIFPESAKKSSIDDLCLLLSFLTGRVVGVREDHFRENLNPGVYSDKVVYPNYFLSNNFSWKKLEDLRTQGLAAQFYNFTLAYQTTDFVAKATHYNNALNVSCDYWHKDKPRKFLSKDVRAKLKQQIGDILDHSNTLDVVKNDILQRVGNLYSPSALFKLRSFLTTLQLYPVIENPVIEAPFIARLRWLNTIRNAMVHTGALPKPDNVDSSLVPDITASMVDLIGRINQYYFGHVFLGLDDPYINRTRKMIAHYFNTGNYSGHRIFEQTVAEFLEREEQEWMS